MAEKMDLSDIIARIQKLIALAEEGNTTPEEAQAAQLKADALMQQYKLEEENIQKLRPAADRMKPKWILVPLAADPDLIGYVAHLAERVAWYTDCRIRTYGGGYFDGAYHAKVYGFESDLRYYEILYTTLRLHMVGALRPGIDPTLSVEDNTYILHSSGLNWFDIAKMYGWYGPVEPLPGESKLVYINRNTRERASWGKSINQFKLAYKRAITERGEDALHISPSGVKTFQLNAADGYSNRISQRLRENRDRQPIGAALAMRVDMVSQFFKEDNPDLFPSEEELARQAAAPKGRQRAVRYVSRPYNAEAYGRGVRHANTANLNPATSPGSNQKEIR